jgi:hypothetical protein
VTSPLLNQKRLSFAMLFKAAAACALIFLGTDFAHSQVQPEVKYEYSPSQITVLFQHTLDDYNVENFAGMVSRVELNGGTVEYANRHFYPFEIIGRASYATGQPLGQKLMSFTGGAGYTREFRWRYAPFGTITAGMAHTSSNQSQYLFTSGNSGFALNLDAGLDVNLTRRWGVRAIEIQNQYLPFGVKGLGSVYWSLGAGAYYRFGK